TGARSLRANLFGQQTPEAESQLQSMEKSAQSLLSLVKDLLELEKAESGKLDLDIDNCSLGDVIEGAICTVRLLANEKQITVHAPGCAVTAELDEVRIEQ